MPILNKLKIVDGFWLKVVMAALMLLDHMHWFLPGMPYWFHQVSRIVAPVFAFLVAEGMYHTSNRPSYLKRLYGFASLMLAGDVVLYLIFGDFPPNSILMSLAIAASMVYCIDKLRAKEGNTVKHVLLLVFLAVAATGFEGAHICSIVVLVCYYLRDKPLIMCGVYLVSTAAYLLLLGMLFDTQGLMLLAVIPFLLYNGKRGVSNTFSKYFFYVFYPLHIWVLFVIQQFS